MVKQSTYKEQFQDQMLQKYVAQGYNLYQALFMAVKKAIEEIRSC